MFSAECNAYIECNNGQKKVVLCPEGQTFNKVTLTCDSSENSDCFKAYQAAPYNFICEPEDVGLDFVNEENCAWFWGNQYKRRMFIYSRIIFDFFSKL